jgi:tRNA/tmRNA/rRNA uracil-C5-methylase (TrmA/RlmC/RlmD family)
VAGAPYERQLEEKEAQVRDALERIGGFEARRSSRSSRREQLRYRNKLEYSFGEDETASSCSASTAPAAAT